MDYNSILRPSWLEIDVENLRYNLKNIRSYNKDVDLCGVIKADGYGIGSTFIAREMEEIGYDYLAVATLIEALELRASHIKLPILILGYMGESDPKHIINNNITQTIYSYDQALKLSKAAESLNSVAKVHIKIDTGMSRLGFQTNEDSVTSIKSIFSLNNLEVEGVFSHFMDAENSDKSLCHNQYKRFITFLKRLEEEKIYFKLRHISNSGGIIDLESYKLDMVRAGIILYGLYPYNVDKSKLDLKVSSSLKTRIADVKFIKKGDYVGYSRGYIADKDMKVATIPIGYADGYLNEIPEIIKPKIRNLEAPVIGNICMDQTMLDVTKIEGLEIGEIVTLFDYNDQDKIDIKWPTVMARRVPRVYIKNKSISYVDYYLLKD